MVEVYGSTLKIPHGDSAKILISIQNKLSGEPYQLGQGESLRFTVSSGPNMKETLPILEKRLTEQDAERRFLVALTPRETSIPKGRYRFRVMICNEDRGTVDTVIGGLTEADLLVT